MNYSDLVKEYPQVAYLSEQDFQDLHDANMFVVISKDGKVYFESENKILNPTNVSSFIMIVQSSQYEVTYWKMNKMITEQMSKDELENYTGSSIITDTLKHKGDNDAFEVNKNGEYERVVAVFEKLDDGSVVHRKITNRSDIHVKKLDNITNYHVTRYE